MRSALRYLRHGPLKQYHSLWTGLGKCYRHFIKLFPFFPTVQQKIGPYGPFRFHPRFTFSAFHQWGGQHNGGFNDCVENCRHKHCVFDIGAHIGLVTMPMSKMLAPHGTLYAFEPATANRRYLEYHLKKNKLNNVKVIPLLVGNSNTDTMSFYELDADTGMNSVLSMAHRGKFKPLTKQQITLDTFCQQHQLKPEIMKIDVEGYELEVLQGAKETLIKNNVRIYLSVHPRHIKALKHSLSELVDFIHSIGYQITELDGSSIKEFNLNEYLVKKEGAI